LSLLIHLTQFIRFTFSPRKRFATFAVSVTGLYSIDDVFRSMAEEISEFGRLTLATIGDNGIPFIQTGETVPLLQKEAERKAKGIIVG